jgi:hypothetical protein
MVFDAEISWKSSICKTEKEMVSPPPLGCVISSDEPLGSGTRVLM